jgi:hypothetical protein
MRRTRFALNNAVRVRPSVVLAVVPADLNIVLQRLEPAQDEDRFDLVIASNMFVYYDVVEQSLARANVAAMLRAGGVLLSNNSLPTLPATAMRVAGATRVVCSRRPATAIVCETRFLSTSEGTIGNLLSSYEGRRCRRPIYCRAPLIC